MRIPGPEARDFINHINWKISTTRQQPIATGNSPRPASAMSIPTTSANAPASGVPADSTMAGNVITARVT